MDISIKKDYATIAEYKDAKQPNANEVRVYCVQFPDVFGFQIRTHKGTGDFGKGKPRNMIAHVQLTIAEVEDILAQMKAHAAS
jgi:hypothetical protein